MLKYTIGFIKRGNEILLLNRESPSWMGSWNGVGGKLKNNETPMQCIIREVHEETGIILRNMKFKGTVTWDSSSGDYNGMYSFLGEVPEDYEFETPLQTREGILDWKKIDWILHPDNTGVANLHYFLPTMLEDEKIYEHHFVYRDRIVESFERRNQNMLQEVF